MARKPAASDDVRNSIQLDGANLQRREGMHIRQGHASRRRHLEEVLSTLWPPFRVPVQGRVSQSPKGTDATYREAIGQLWRK